MAPADTLETGSPWINNSRTSLKVANLANTPVQNHVFGDIVKRQISGELRVRF